MVPDFVIFIVVSALCFQNDLSIAFNIEISPNTVNGLVHNDVSILCHLDNYDVSDVKEVVFIDVSREGKAVAAFRQHSKLSIAEGLEDKFQAEGNISATVEDSYLRVTLLNPRLEDAGNYECLLYYLDDSGLLKEKKTSASLNVTNDDLESALIYLVSEVTSLKTEIHGEKNRSKELRSKVYTLTNQLQYVKKHHTKENSSVMFTAVHTSREVLRAGHALVFNDVITNEGQAYNSNSGVFTAPVDGYYLFEVSLAFAKQMRLFFVLRSSKGVVLTNIVIGDYIYQDYAGGSCLAKLEAGETVTPSISYAQYSPRLYQYRTADRMNRFSGFLLKTL